LAALPLCLPFADLPAGPADESGGGAACLADPFIGINEDLDVSFVIVGESRFGGIFAESGGGMADWAGGFRAGAAAAGLGGKGAGAAGLTGILTADSAGLSAGLG
jgi:hypothetical protein